ncbi:hypothetical protein [Psychroserpens mesophilus]|uniref:hypothetical protein n=1 Tax=Psychroserpens mesophilus TaxID=325473 RepID=UPI00058BADAD|nr:hypothetical protein [Psychroserpens mesophilus]
MKRLYYILFGVFLVFIVLIYWSVSSTSKTFQTCNIANSVAIDSIDFKAHDSVLIAASTLYAADEVKALMQGNQYREVWSTPVMVPIVFLDTLYGGMTIVKEGGGKQTHSLRLKSKKGIEYTLRSVNKDPEPLIPEFAKTLGLENIVVDGISAQHPYAALVVAQLSDHANIINTNPKLVFVPKQKQLQKYNEAYGNRLYLLEFETEGDINWTHLEAIDKLVDTETLQEMKLNLRNELSIDKKALIRARLFDFIIGDWDRHAKQWGWAVQKKENKYIAIPIAGDRDNAFFNPEGLIPTVLSNEYVIPELRPFKEDIDFMEGLVYPFDRYFLIDTPEELFMSEARFLQEQLTDSVIQTSMNIWPESVAKLSEESIVKKIKHRRDDLITYAKQFKFEIDKQGLVKTTLKGSDDIEFTVGFINCFECL